MPSVTIILTRHEELGKCNSLELYNILERLNPEIIFEELPPQSFDSYYVYKNRRNLESDAIGRFVEKYRNPHIGVDSNNIPPEDFFFRLWLPFRYD